jgi:Glucose/sorbosone dehydrogenases
MNTPKVGFAALLLTVMLAFLALFAVSANADPLSGLDARPSNPTCLAGPMPGPKLKYQTVFPQITAFKPFDLRQMPAPGDANRWYFISREGKVYTFLAPNGQPQLVLDISDRIGVLNLSNAYAPGGSEHWGLSSFALHPDFASNGRMFVLYNGRQASETAATSYVASYQLNGSGVFDRGTEKLIISKKQTNSVNHHFGHLAFGPDGYLYIGSGDDSVQKSVQRCDGFHGKILRIDVNTTGAYAIPPDNPFVGNPACRGEIYALGFRNPWRFSFDPQTGKLWVGDVGSWLAEEVDVVQKGGNYGWPITEGFICRATGDPNCADPALLPPVYAYPHGTGSVAMIGGHVYRGSEPTMQSLRGTYLFSIFGVPDLFSLRQDPAANTWSTEEASFAAANLSSHFVDRAGEFYSLNGQVANPTVSKLVPDPGAMGEEGIPAVLSETGCVERTQPRKAVSGAIPYSVISPLWSDGAEKHRWLALPDGQRATIQADGDFQFPIGTVLMKEFALAGRPVETRLLKRHTNGGWAGYTYAWRADLSDADLVPAAGMTDPGTNWHFPSRTQCLVCHTEAAGFALGPEILQLNHISPEPYPQTGREGNELATWASIGLFSTPLPAPVAQLPTMADPSNFRHDYTLRSRSYLHSNCSGCHRPNGPTRVDLDFRYATPPSAMHACNVAPAVSDLGVPGAEPIVVQRIDKSLAYLRMTRRDSNQMPPLGTTRVDTAAASVLETWIRVRGDVNGVPWDACTDVVDSDGDGVPDNSDNCITKYNPDQADMDNDRIGNRCDGDFNNDFVVDQQDRERMIPYLGGSFDKPHTYGNWHGKYDLNGDGYIDQADLDIFDRELLGHPRGPSALRND